MNITNHIPVLLSLSDGECAGCGTRAQGNRRSSRGGLGASDPSAPCGDLKNSKILLLSTVFF